MNARRGPETSWERSLELLDRLPTLPSQERIEAVEQLLRSPSPMVRERALRTGAVVIPDDRLEAYLRSDADDVMRNAGLEMLKLRGPRGFSLAARLLRDHDADVVLQSVLALGHSRDLRALEPLRGVLGHSDPNVVQAAIEAVGRLGDARAVPDLVPYLAAEPWLQMAAIQALGELRDRSANRALAPLLTDLLVGPMAAEALARIGGPPAFRLLARHLLRFGEETDREGLLGLLAHVLEGLRRVPRKIDGLEELVVKALCGSRSAGEGLATAVAAARCLLCLGRFDHDREAVSVLAGDAAESVHLPACLERRSDLVPTLLEMPGKPRCWGFLLIARRPRTAPRPAMLAAVESSSLEPDLIKTAVGAFDRVRGADLAAGLLGFYRRSQPEQRRTLLPLLATQRRCLPALLPRCAGLGEDDRLLLAARCGMAPKHTARAIERLAPARRSGVLEQLTDVPELARSLPWKSWLEEDPDRWADLAARVAADFNRRDLLPSLRQLLATHPTPALLRAIGDLGDRESLPLLAELLELGDARLAPLVLEALGRIGGPEARRVLRRVVAEQGTDERIAYRALSICAVVEDDEIFRRAAGHSDWYVRLSCAEVLGRFPRAENLEALAHLASDPVPLVAQRALSFLDS